MNALIMAGGSGSRFWPLSRRNLPKQFLSLSGDSSLMAQTYARLKGLARAEDIYIVTAERYSELTRAHAPELPGQNLILEPFGRNTAACVGLSSLIFEQHGKGEEAVVVCPADHIIGDRRVFEERMEKAGKLAMQGWLVVLGITPSSPSPHYGYIKEGRPIEAMDGTFTVGKFVEKPDRERASRMLEKGGYYWNAGIFVWTPSSIMKAIEKHMPDLFEGLITIKEELESPRREETIEKVYGRLESVPIDKGVLERADKLAVLPAEMGWRDVGSWSTLFNMLKNDDGINVQQGETLAVNCKESLFWSTGRLVTAVGVEKIAVVETADAVLVCSLERDQDIKKLIDLLEKKGYGQNR